VTDNNKKNDFFDEILEKQKKDYLQRKEALEKTMS
jgi:hypothetical protein